MIVPYYLTPDYVIGLVEALYSLGGAADAMHLGDLLGENIDSLPHVIDVAEALGLVRLEDGDVRLTDLGKNIAEGNIKVVKKVLRQRLSLLEPLNEVLSLLKSRKRIDVEEFRDVIAKYYLKHVKEAEKTLLQWGAFLNLFKMSEDDNEIYLLREH
ncbi:MAG: AAA-associated domain-containing protein [Desulfurococcaceae archaeon]